MIVLIFDKSKPELFEIMQSNKDIQKLEEEDMEAEK
jgi:hypothetical protein